TNQLPCALRVYSPVDSHTCQTSCFVFQDGSNEDLIGRRQEHTSAEAHRDDDVSVSISTAQDKGSCIWTLC
ncbi:hypothetical protein A2U01_0081551, partial [Trifolium medium]|nr:hypothetical protein [Trifolium medium]